MEDIKKYLKSMTKKEKKDLVLDFVGFAITTALIIKVLPYIIIFFD